MRKSLSLLVTLLLVRFNTFPAPEQVHAQGQYFLDETSERLPVREDRSRDGILGDFDGDGYLDIVVSTPDVSIFRPYYIPNDGLGIFPENGLQDLFIVRYNLPAVATGDIERDGDLDLLFAAYGDRIKLLVNEIGQFTDESDERLPLHIEAFAKDGAFIDVDSDLFKDVTFVQFGGNGMIWVNDSKGYFGIDFGRFPTGFIYSNAFVWGDVDGDLDVDCVIANNTGYANMMMINDATGWFRDETEERLPIDSNPTNGITMVDVDGDKDLDIVVGSGTPPGYNQIWINDGTGHFTDESDERLPYVWDTTLGVTSGDIDNDGDFDLLIANNGMNNRFNRVLINDGLGFFTDETDQRYPFVEEQTLTMVPGDVDSDGDLDCLVVNFGESSDPFSGQNRLLINISTPDSFPPIIPRTFHHPDTGDTTNPYLISTTVWDNISVVIGELGTSLFYRAFSDTSRSSSEVELEFSEIPMLDCGGFLYRERIPAQSSMTTVEYYIKAEDRMGNISYDPPNAPDSVFSFLVDVNVGIDDDLLSSQLLPKTFSLSQNYPNPFNPSTTISFDIPSPVGTKPSINLTIYDLRGRRVRTLIDSSLEPGSHKIHWDGRNDRGQSVASGIYLYTLRTGEERFTRKMTVLK